MSKDLILAVVKLVTGWFGQLILSLSIFFLPIRDMVYVIGSLIVLDMITSVMRQWKEHKNKGEKILLFAFPFVHTNRIIIFKSSEAKKTIIKTFLYIAFISVCYALPFVITGHHLYLPHLAVASIGSVELISIAENSSIATNNGIFTKIVKSVVSKLNKSISETMENNK